MVVVKKIELTKHRNTRNGKNTTSKKKNSNKRYEYEVHIKVYIWRWREIKKTIRKEEQTQQQQHLVYKKAKTIWEKDEKEKIQNT